MTARSRKAPIAVLAALAVLVLAGCGESHTRVTTGTYAGESGANAPYLNVGSLIYQVQLSRQLNPYNNEDAAYLEGLPPGLRKLPPGEEWFAVFLQVYNETNYPQLASTMITVSDTQRNIYYPIPLPASNMFAYQGGHVPGKGQIPVPGTAERAFGTQGQLLLFRIPVVALDNRPLELKVIDPLNPKGYASAELDV
jgi:hypothetical protein